MYLNLNTIVFIHNYKYLRQGHFYSGVFVCLNIFTFLYM